MPFLRAGFNAKHRRTGVLGWTRAVTGKRFEPARLVVFEGGDFAWLGIGERFLAWGEQVVLGSYGIELSEEHQFGLPASKLELRARPAPKVAFTIYGEPASKANSRELVSMNRLSRKTGRMVKMPALIKSEKAREYERDALLQIPPTARCRFDGPVRVTLHVYYVTERPDLDESVILDVMQDRYAKQGEERVLVQRGVYRNDRQVREKHVYWHKDKANPRAEIEVEPMALQVDLLIEAAAA